MRFLVDLYRLIILAALALGIVGGSYLVFLLLFSDETTAQLNGLAITWLLIAAVLMILAIGLIATFVSIHDRISEISDHSRRIAEALERGEFHANGLSRGL